MGRTSQTHYKRSRSFRRGHENHEKIQTHSSPPPITPSTGPLSDPKASIRMKGVQYLAALLLLLFVQISISIPLQEEHSSSEMADSVSSKAPGFSSVKRHSEGTFANDYSKYLENRRTQDFVQWLMNAKANGGPSKRQAEGTSISAASSYLQDQAVQSFISWLKSAHPTQE
ncbi:hypothetical protein DNTS_009784 [Danionella cerebrum]|uniref:Glucagon / GIP / secretin / VIP family domain-containing protein n=1 Tax=Danionella cerebrum TaxID=2873325 RepID=A0A553RLI2_9TELE|nr:hypothetical protein DNTS_033378 [Danionella translucida]TRZ03025.1 hypothetical protein DNTS_009784 [Danionella translucida]